MTTRFYNPYQFVPVTGTINDKEIRDHYDTIANGKSTQNPSARHDLWLKNAFSGRIICKLVLETPTIVGKEQVTETGKIAALVKQYTWRNNAAIPGNSLKGMIGSIAETLSQSSLRVLSDTRALTDDQIETEADKAREFSLNSSTTVYDSLSQINEDLLPWSDRRNKLTPAEILFGVVEINDSDSNRDGTNNLAGRLRFHDAQSSKKITQLAEVTLKTLGSPKPSYPSLYRHMEGKRGEFLSPAELYTQAKNLTKEVALPNGRKFYLHHQPNQIAGKHWVTNPVNNKKDKLRLRCQLMEAEQIFYFAIDFTNLSSAELTLLEKSLVPDAGYQHHIGLGKSLGLGSISISTEAIFILDHECRYAQSTALQDRAHYQSIWQTEQTSPQPEEWETLYPQEAKALKQESVTAKPDVMYNPTLIDAKSLEQVCQLGNPKYLEPDIPVHSPIMAWQRSNPEKEGFKWFSHNNKTGAQALGEIIPKSYLPSLYYDADKAKSAGKNEAKKSPPEYEPWLTDTLHKLRQGPEKDEDILKAKPLAKELAKVTDKKEQARLYLHIKEVWKHLDISHRIGHKALNEYTKISNDS